MVTAPVKTLKGFIVPIGVALVLGNFNPWVLGGAAAALIGMIATGLFTYLTFRYQVGTQHLEIRQGLISRSRRTIPLERVRGVDITSTLLHRLLGLAVVKVEAAAGGDRDEEGTLDAVTATEAERLRRALLYRRALLRGEVTAPERPEGEPRHATEGESAPAPASAVTGGAPGSGGPETVYFVMPPSWYLYALLSIAYLVTPFAALAAVMGLVGQVVSEAGVTEEALEWLVVHETSLVLWGSVAILATLLLLMPVFAVVSYGVAHWGFTLWRRDGSLVAERGLFTRRSVTLEYRRIRGYELLDSPLERMRGAVRLRAVVTGLGDTATRAMLLPIGARDRVARVIERALEPFRGRLVPHPRAALGRRLIRAVGPFAALAVLGWASGFPVVAGVLAFLALLGVPLGVDRYRSLGHGFDGRRVSVRSGSLRREQAVVGSDAIIGWAWSQSPFQRRSGLANLELAVGAGGGSYTAIDAGFQESVDFAGTITPEMVRPFLVAPHTPDDEPAPDRSRSTEGENGRGSR
ncbi:hypothetical protein EFW17_09895 [Halostreptopolyspora alba]|uniref:YdbS-like PH domain-containing protein n=2 Tax=Halostreptopolyspora alba TaxID=2487137 RepID=A0A3N0EBD1_9ACTN|nr:hypothetical protein EFW17_09895 [Nocardiopsaceae bacterium YIM 96095]